jgi:hypothetical protein
MKFGRVLYLWSALLLGGFVTGGARALPIDFSNFHTPAQLKPILDELKAAHPTLCDVQSIGNSVEGQPIWALKISGTAPEASKGDVVFIGLHHAREWITVETALYLAERLLNEYGANPQVQADINRLRIWIIPVANPDGYAYTQLPPINPSDPQYLWPRYWRKNRRNNGDGTFGVDLNRNWGYQWGLNSGSSPNTSDDTYRGPTAFSEPEIIHLRNFIQGLANPKTLLSYHSFSELFLRPWAYTTADSPGEPILNALAERSISVIAAVHGHTYAEEISYTSSGEATDYLWGERRVSGFTPELRPTLAGLGGFSPPPSEILPTAEENYPAALALIHDAGSREVWMRDYAGDSGAEPSAVWTGSGWSQAFWVSPDIWTQPATLTQGSTVTLKVRIQNNTGAPKHNVRLDVYYTDPRISLEFPNPNSILIGSDTVTVPSAGKEVSFPWVVPTGFNSWGELHWCVGAVISHPTDLPLTTQAERSSNIGIRNFNTEPVVAGSNLIVAATNFLDVEAELVVTVDRENLRRGWTVALPEVQPRTMGPRPTAIERKARLLNAKGRLLQPGETVYLPVRVNPPAGARVGDAVDVNVHGALVPLVAGTREAVGNGYTYRVIYAPK